MRRTGWLKVDLSGLEKLLSRRGKQFIVYELIQNAWDEPCSVVEISLPRPKNGKTRLVVQDDSPNGFENLDHAYTLFAESYKKANPRQRGMFNAGEKFVLALCEEASIISTRGGIVFDARGRRRTTRRRERGTEFCGLLRLTTEDWESLCRSIQMLLPPVRTIFNGQPIAQRAPIHRFSCVLPTVEANQEGNLRRKSRKTEVTVFEPLAGEPASLYELGLPVVPTGDKWHINVHQKVPLNLERDNVSPAYLQAIRVAAVNEMSQFLNRDDAAATWVRQAASDPRIDSSSFDKVMDLRFGDKRVTHDPSDPEANLLAVSQGYVVIGSSSLTHDEWTNVRRFGSSLPAGRVTPSPKPFAPGGTPLKLLDAVNKSGDHVAFEQFATAVAAQLIGKTITVVFANDPGWGFSGCYGNAQLTVNVSAREQGWFSGAPAHLIERWIPFLIHELAHDSVHGHLTEEYHRECCRLAGILARLLYEKPTLFGVFHSAV